MRHTILFLFITSWASAQTLDTIYTTMGNVVAKQSQMTVTQVQGDQVTEVKESINYNKAIKKIEQLMRDTANFSQYLTQLKQTEDQIAVERRRVRLLRRDAIALLDRLKALLPSLE